MLNEIDKNAYLYLGHDVELFPTAKTERSERFPLDDHAVVGHLVFANATDEVRIDEQSRLESYILRAQTRRQHRGNFSTILHGTRLMGESDHIHGLFTSPVPLEHRNVTAPRSTSARREPTASYTSTSLSDAWIVIAPSTFVKFSSCNWAYVSTPECHQMSKQQYRKFILERARRLFTQTNEEGGE